MQLDKSTTESKHAEVWSIRTKLQIEGRGRDLALFNLAIHSKLRGCDVVNLRGMSPHMDKSSIARPCVRGRLDNLSGSS